MRVRIVASAKREMDEIWRYWRMRASEVTANKEIGKIVRGIHVVAMQPGLREERGRSFWLFPNRGGMVCDLFPQDSRRNASGACGAGGAGPKTIGTPLEDDETVARALHCAAEPWLIRCGVWRES